MERMPAAILRLACLCCRAGPAPSQTSGRAWTQQTPHTPVQATFCPEWSGPAGRSWAWASDQASGPQPQAASPAQPPPRPWRAMRGLQALRVARQQSKPPNRTPLPMYKSAQEAAAIPCLRWHSLQQDMECVSVRRACPGILIITFQALALGELFMMCSHCTLHASSGPDR